MNHFPSNILADLLTEKIKRDNSPLYVDFVEALNSLASSTDNLKQLEAQANELSAFMPYLDLTLSMMQDYEDILNMKATLLDLFVNDLDDRSIYLMVQALASNKNLANLQHFIHPIEYWVVVINSKERLAAA